MHSALHSALTVLAFLALSGCDAFLGPSAVARGVVADRATGRTAAAVRVEVGDYFSGEIGPVTVSSPRWAKRGHTRTGSDGRFEMSYRTDDPPSHIRAFCAGEPGCISGSFIYRLSEFSDGDTLVVRGTVTP